MGGPIFDRKVNEPLHGAHLYQAARMRRRSAAFGARMAAI
jgi:hypothetical protein